MSGCGPSLPTPSVWCRRATDDEAVVGGIGNSNFDLFAVGHRPQNFYMLGSMGLAAPIALGVAMAQPERGVIALEGDGSILMSLGCLTTIANLKPRNLTVIIWDNGLYQITGKQVTATGGVTDIVAVARAAGIAASHWVCDEAHFEQLIDRRFENGGPLFLAAKIDDQPGAAQPPRRSGPGAQPLHEGARHRTRRRAGCLSRVSESNLRIGAGGVRFRTMDCRIGWGGDASTRSGHARLDFGIRTAAKF
jgi:hypothetical protein